MPAQQESVTLTFVFTDLVGSTEILQRLGEERARTVFERHHQQLSAAVAEHGGEELEWLGDGMLAAFASSVQAIRCAIAMQRTTRRLVAAQRLGMRIGVHTGEAMRRDGGYFGNTLVIARRLCDTADAGQILTTGFVAAMLAGRQFSFRQLGSVDLKGIDQSLAVVEVTSGRSRTAVAATPPADEPAAATPRRERRMRLAILAGTMVAGVALIAATALLLGGGTPGAAPSTDAGLRPSVLQLLPLVMWRDAASGELRHEPVGWASGIIVDDRGLVLTSQQAIAPAGYSRPFDAIGIAFADDAGLAGQPAYLAQVVAAGESGSELAVLMITSDIQGEPVQPELAAADTGDPAAVSRGQSLELVGYPSGAAVPLRTAQTKRTTDARDFEQSAGQLTLIETSAQLTPGEWGGGAFDDDGLVGVLAPASAVKTTAAVIPWTLARAMIDRVTGLLDAPAGGAATASLVAPRDLPAHSFEFAATATISGMANGTRWSWSCIAPDGSELANAWPPVLAWSAGTAGVKLELDCRRWDGFELLPGGYRLQVLRWAPDGSQQSLAEAAVEVGAAPGEARHFRAQAWPPEYELEIPVDFGCPSCAEAPYSGLLVLELPTGDGQFAFRSYFGSDYQATPPAELIAELEVPGLQATAGPTEVEIDGQPAVRLEATVTSDFEGSGPLAGARFLAGTRGVWTFLSVDGVSFGMSAETVESAGWQERLAAMEAVAGTISFR